MSERRCGLLKSVESTKPDRVYLLLKDSLDLVGFGPRATIKLDRNEECLTRIYFVIMTDCYGRVRFVILFPIINLKSFTFSVYCAQ